jgi:hypothetical protein
MNIVPSLIVTRFAQLEPGDLFILPCSEGACVAMKVIDPTGDGEMLMVLLGPVFPDGLTHPSLVSAPSATVISFGKEYTLRLPSHAEGWRASPPAPETHCIVVTERGAYVRANFVAAQGLFQPCYLDMGTGIVVTTGTGRLQNFSPPPGHLSFASEWEILTTEKEPRSILTYPW